MEALVMHAALPLATASASLREVLPHARFQGCRDLQVEHLTDDSRLVQPGSLFAVIAGTCEHGAKYIRDAMARGASGLLVERPQPHCELPQCVVPNVREAYARVSAVLAGRPDQAVRVAGVTGTNGKTTVAWMMHAMFAAGGKPAGLLGTIENHDGRVSEPATLTTPAAGTLHEWLARMQANGATDAAMEVSSHALDQQRLAGIQLQSAAVTNVTRDHLDYHGTYESYWTAKTQILSLIRPGGVAVLSRDNAASWEMRPLASPEISVVSSGLNAQADVHAEIVRESRSGMEFRLRIHGASAPCHLPMIGRHNVENALTAAALTWHHSRTIDEIAYALERFRGVPGRLQAIDCGQPFDVYVDYAHTDDALRRCLSAVRRVTGGQLICVFGAGGDRDSAKRPLMGAAAALADIAVLTSDNPRSEPPEEIMRQILAGFPSDSQSVMMEPDRSAAIEKAVELAGTGDAIVIAGKGHERTQQIGSRVVPFDDCQVARDAISRREERGRAELLEVMRVA
jgi:UDP-N-acetylmuramoyl-L-alanyl-D-glutamate--2,6-diaminopimelate ligase